MTAHRQPERRRYRRPDRQVGRKCRRGQGRDSPQCNGQLLHLKILADRAFGPDGMTRRNAPIRKTVTGSAQRGVDGQDPRSKVAPKRLGAETTKKPRTMPGLFALLTLESV